MTATDTQSGELNEPKAAYFLTGQPPHHERSGHHDRSTVYYHDA